MKCNLLKDQIEKRTLNLIFINFEGFYGNSGLGSLGNPDETTRQIVKYSMHISKPDQTMQIGKYSIYK